MIIRESPTTEQRDFSINIRDNWDWENTTKHFEQDKIKVLFSIIAEIIVSDLTGNERPKEKGLKSDGGWDVLWKGKNWDVKTEFRTVRFNKKFNHNVNEGQIKNKTNGYIFVSYNQSNGEYEICGWITKEDFLKFAEFKKPGEVVTRTDGSTFTTRGSNGMYMILHKYINEFKSVKELTDPGENDATKK